MFALMPRTRRTSLLPRIDSPFAGIPEDLGTLVDRLLTSWPAMETPEWPNWWGLTTEENDKEFVVRFELPGFEPAEVKVELTGDRLTVEAEHKEPAAKNEVKAMSEERADRAHVRRVLTLPPGIEPDKAEATYRNGVLEVHIPRAPEAVGRRIKVKT
jgi:HSP20 family molecular chaperone IbpA